jgi:hypothetical protein
MTHPYASGDFARSLVHVGRACPVPEWDSHVLTRPAPHGGRHDAVGPYPLTVITRDADVAAGVARLKAAGLISVVAVLDDRLRPDPAALEAAFDTVRPFKSHYVHDRTQGPFAYDKHHRYEIRRALTRVSVREIALSDHLPAWAALYGQLAERHGLGGLHDFPLAHHATLATLPGLRAFAAFLKGEMVSAHLFVTHGGYAVSHLAASAPEGYRTGAAYAVNDLALAELTDCEAINFGGGAGLGDDPSDGLVRFKKGFCNHVASAWLCGAILDHDAYRNLSGGHAEGGFFPAYRGPRQLERSHEHSR